MILNRLTDSWRDVVAGLSRMLTLAAENENILPLPTNIINDAASMLQALSEPCGEGELVNVKPVFALWVLDGGVDGKGCWMVDISYPNNDYPCVAYSYEDSLCLLNNERAAGLNVILIELRAVRVHG